MIVDSNYKLSYEKIPYQSSQNIKVFPLSKEGLDEYISNDHKSHNFISKWHPAHFFNNLKLIKTVENNINEQNSEKDISSPNQTNHYRITKSQDTSYIKTNPKLFKKINNESNFNIINKNNKNNNELKINKINISTNLLKNLKPSIPKITCTTTKNNPTKLITTFNNLPKPKHDGFTRFQIPHTKNLDFTMRKDNSTPNILYNDKIKHTLETNGKNFNKNCNLDQDEKIYDLIINENKKMENIIKNQTDTNFLRKNRLPKIKRVTVSQIDFLSNTNLIGNSKLIGGRYNPVYNYDINQLKNRTSRNVFGALFMN